MGIADLTGVVLIFPVPYEIHVRLKMCVAVAGELLGHSAFPASWKAPNQDQLAWRQVSDGRLWRSCWFWYGSGEIVIDGCAGVMRVLDLESLVGGFQ